MASLVFRKYVRELKEAYRRTRGLLYLDEAMKILLSLSERPNVVAGVRDSRVDGIGRHVRTEKVVKKEAQHKKLSQRQSSSGEGLLTTFFSTVSEVVKKKAQRAMAKEKPTTSRLSAEGKRGEESPYAELPTKTPTIEHNTLPDIAGSPQQKLVTEVSARKTIKPVIQVPNIIVESGAPTSQAELPARTHKFKVLLNVESYDIQDDPSAFLAYFRSRYKILRAILLRRLETLQDSNSSYLVVLVDRKVDKGSYGVVIGDYQDKSGEFRRGMFLVDFTNSQNAMLRRKFEKILPDVVVAFKVRKSSREKFFVEDIVFPDVPHPRKRNRAPEPCRIMFLSDIHVGSRKFLADYFEQFIKFINGQSGDRRLNELAESIDYVIITGDVVDGIGVYPSQREELAVDDIYQQYQIAADMLARIPEHIKIIIIPGNHDASTSFLPQPPMPKEFAQPLYDMKNVTILSNPALVEISGVKILLYHGLGLEKVASALHMGIERSTRIIVELLRYRHLLPIWGSAPIANTSRDYLVINEVPDIIAMGHVHIFDAHITKGDVLTIVSGAFQDITSWQIKLGIVPTPGKFASVDISTYTIDIIQFTGKSTKILKSIR